MILQDKWHIIRVIDRSLINRLMDWGETRHVPAAEKEPNTTHKNWSLLNYRSNNFTAAVTQFININATLDFFVSFIKCESMINEYFLFL